MDARRLNLGQLSKLHSPVPYSMEAQKPIFWCNGADGLKGANITKTKERAEHFEGIVSTLEQVLEPGF